jgi:hypothetical protein
MIGYADILKFSIVDEELTAQIKYNGATYDDVPVVSLFPLQSFPRSNCFGLVLCLRGESFVVLPLETSLKFLPTAEGEFMFGDIESESYLQYKDGKVNLQVMNIKLLQIIQELMLLIHTNFQSIQSGFNALSGMIIPPQSPSPQALTVAGQMSTVANNLTTENNEINDKITTLKNALI